MPGVFWLLDKASCGVLYEKFSLKPEECFFIDDVQKNIDGAKATGMNGHCHSSTDIEGLKNALRAVGVKI